MPPTPQKVPVDRVFHGDTVTDPFEWLRDKNDPQVIDYLTAQNAYTDEVMKPTEELQKAIFNEIKSRTKETDTSVPFFDRGWWYFARTYEGRAYSSYHRVKSDSRPDPDVVTDGEQLLFDQNVLAEGHEFFSTAGFEVSPDGSMLALAVDIEGDERFTIRIMEIESGEFSLAGAIAGTEAMGRWWTAVPRAHWPRDAAAQRRIRAAFDPVFGDRRQELVFIGSGMDEAAIRRGLDACLVGDTLTMTRFNPDRYRHLPDPFPAWGLAS